MILTNMIMCWLAVFAASATLSSLDGPFGLAEKLRSSLRKHPEKWVRNGIECAICVSFWVAPFIAGGLFTPRTTIEIFQLWLSSVGFVAAVAWLSPPAEED